MKILAVSNWIKESVIFSSRISPTRFGNFMIGIIWAIGIAVGVQIFYQYENKPGVLADAPKNWPAESRIELSQDLPTLIMFVHPKCPCSRAALDTLLRLKSRYPNNFAAYALFIKPEGTESNWVQTDLWRSAKRVPGVHVVMDIDGAEAERFHVSTSGQTLIYNAQGKLEFSGGITPGRGHYGDSRGSHLIEEILNKKLGSSSQHFAVFGCPLFNKKGL